MKFKCKYICFNVILLDTHTLTLGFNLMMTSSVLTNWFLMKDFLRQVYCRSGHKHYMFTLSMIIVYTVFINNIYLGRMVKLTQKY